MRSFYLSASSSAIAIAIATMGSALLATSAGAVTCGTAAGDLCIGVSENTQDVPSGSFAVATGSGILTYTGQNFGFSYTSTATGTPPLAGGNLLQGSTVDVEDYQGLGSASTFYLYITETGLVGPSALTPFLSQFTVNGLSSGWSVTESTYISSSNTPFGQTTPLSSYTSTALGSSSGLGSATPGADYSVTEVFAVTDNQTVGDSANLTIDVSQAPIPATFPLLAAGLAGLWGVTRTRRKGSRLSSAQAV
jgi:hypothetical protein